VEKTYNILEELLISNIVEGMKIVKNIIEDKRDGIEFIKVMIGEIFVKF